MTDQCLRIDPSRHEVLPDGDYVKGARRHCNLEELFIYRHRETGQFVLAGWVEKGSMCIELMAWGGERLMENAPTYHEVAWRVRPVAATAAEGIREIREARRQRALRNADSVRIRDEQIARVYNRGNERDARAMLLQPPTPTEAVAGEDHLAESLKDIVKAETPKIRVPSLPTA
jgi:hypothetical protein